MYVVTFYSFKGGTGRSMALANAAVELANRGKRVLMVDFDLEAPGLDTFPFRKPKQDSDGLLEFIQRYLDTGAVPDVREFVYETSPIGSEHQGQLWMMPAGRQDESYDGRFKAIDWNDLYEHEQGFLLFEDLKAQWHQSFQPDYVLIDSRTGHTDIGGICTRQLPDAVVVLFLPNEQNRRGLKPVVDAIRSEESGPLNKTIHLHFVMANVPDIDDEEEILAEQSLKCKATLGYEDLSTIIHHFNSLAMLDQALFVIYRPKSKLAKEYVQLVEKIARHNIEDKQGALIFLNDVLRRLGIDRTSLPLAELDTRLQQVRFHHSNDPDVLRRLARLRRMQRRNEEALALLDQVISVGVADSDLLLTRAEILAEVGKTDAALADLTRLFSLSKAPEIDISVAVRLQLKLDSKGAVRLAESPVIDSIDSDGLLEISRELESTIETLPIAERIIKRWLAANSNELSPEELEVARMEFVLCLIGNGKFEEAKLAIGPTEPDPSELDQYAAFNYAMAEWGASGKPPVKFLMRVVNIHESSVESKNPNYAQCLSLSYWAVGNTAKAFEYCHRASSFLDPPEINFSAWSYMTANARHFLGDLQEMEKMLMGEPILPFFIRRASGEALRLFS